MTSKTHQFHVCHSIRHNPKVGCPCVRHGSMSPRTAEKFTVCVPVTEVHDQSAPRSERRGGKREDGKVKKTERRRERTHTHKAKVGACKDPIILLIL